MRTIFAAAVAMAALTGCALPDEALDEAPPGGDVAAGRKLVQERCSSCHATGKSDASPYAPAPPLRTLHEKYDVENLAEAFAEGILVGHKGVKQMPEFVLTPEEIDDLIAYLKSFE